MVSHFGDKDLHLDRLSFSPPINQGKSYHSQDNLHLSQDMLHHSQDMLHHSQDKWALGVSPLKTQQILEHLINYPDREAAHTLREGLVNGFKLQYEGPRFPIFSSNLVSAKQHPNVLQEKIDKEITEGRMAGPFQSPPMLNFHVSPIGIVPKADGGWRMVMHLSYPPSASINHNIDPIHTSVKYTSFDTVIQTISQLGRGTIIAKSDIKSAFRLLKIFPGDFELLGLQFEGKFYFDKCLPFGCSISCKLFEMFSTFLEWLAKERSGFNTIHHYLDDFIFIGSANTSQCKFIMQKFEELCLEIGVPLNAEKTVLPTTNLVFLGLEIDTVKMQVSIPQEKVYQLSTLLKFWVGKRKIKLSELQSLVGKLNFFSKAIPGSRAFNRRFYNAMIGTSKPNHHIRISGSMRQDIKTWIEFLDSFNGVVYFPDSEWSTSDTLKLFTDSAGSAELGCGCYFQDQWMFLQWPEQWAYNEILRDITFLELVPIVLSLMVWGSLLHNKKLILFIDNIALVHILNKQSSRSERVMSLVRPLMLVALKYNIQFKANHIPGKLNQIADSISRKKWDTFRSLAPAADAQPRPIPEQFQTLLSQAK